MFKNKRFILGGALLAMTLAGCGVTIGGGESEETWDISADKEDALKFFNEFVDETVNTAKYKATIKYDHADTVIEQIDGTSEYQEHYHGESAGKDISVKEWLWVEGEKHITAYYNLDEKDKYYVDDIESYNLGYKHFARDFRGFFIEPKSYAFNNKGKRQTKNGVTTASGEVHFIATEGKDYVKFDITTDGTKMLSATLTNFYSSDNESEVTVFAFEYNDSFTFEKPDLSEFYKDE